MAVHQESELKIPSRPAPPPPGSNRGARTASADLFFHTDPFDFKPSRSSSSNSLDERKKPPPPRPPPPKVTKSGKQGRSPLLCVFGRPKETKTAATAIVKPFPAAPVPTSETLIDLHSPTSSPTFTKSSSDISSLGSDCFSRSQSAGCHTESGFEDDFDPFSISTSTTPGGGTDPWSDCDPFSPQKKKNVAINFEITPMTNETKKSKSTKLPKLSKPTIITVKSKPARPPPPIKQPVAPTPPFEDFTEGFSDVDDSGQSLDWSPPMPSAPPPPPPPEVLIGPPIPPRPAAEPKAETNTPYCTAQYDYEATHPDDLSFKAGDIITLTKRVNDEWLCGRLMGKEGLFPENYVNVVVPLDEVQTEIENMIVVALFPFNAETWDDIDLQEGDEVQVLKKINSDWYYGECNGKRGQFPANFVQDITSIITNT